MLNPNKIHEQLVTLGEAWANSNYAADILEETKKTMLAKLMNGLEGSHAAKETIALADAKYHEHLAKMCEARKQANIDKVKYDSAKMWVELLRTQAANDRIATRVAP